MHDFRTLTPLFTELSSERILLRPISIDDAQLLYDAVEEDPQHVGIWIPAALHSHASIDATRPLLINWQAEWLLRTNMISSIKDRTSGRFLGTIGLHTRDWDNGFFEIGYWLRKSGTGQGFMTEATRLLIDFTFTQLKANRIQIRCDARNTASGNVARRLGYVFEGTHRNDSVDGDGNLRSTLFFSLISSEWPTLKTSIRIDH